jgi:hypothetical protein
LIRTYQMILLNVSHPSPKKVPLEFFDSLCNTNRNSKYREEIMCVGVLRY